MLLPGLSLPANASLRGTLKEKKKNYNTVKPIKYQAKLNNLSLISGSVS